MSLLYHLQDVFSMNIESLSMSFDKEKSNHQLWMLFNKRKNPRTGFLSILIDLYLCFCDVKIDFSIFDLNDTIGFFCNMTIMGDDDKSRVIFLIDRS